MDYLYRLPIVELQVSTRPGPRWVQLAYEGEWKGHPDGSFRFDATVFEQMVANFKARAVKIVVDYEHSSGHLGLEAPAAGWISDLKVERDATGRAALWGHVEWTQRAAGLIEAQEYKYLSPTIFWSWKDPSTGDPAGAFLFAVALTNTPFLDQLPELTLSVRPGLNKERGMNEHIKAIMAKLGLPEGTAPEKVVEAVGELATKSEQAATELTAKRTSLKAVYDRLELKENATDTEAIAAVVALRKPAVEAPTDLKALELKVEEQRQQLLSQRVDRAIEDAQRAGKLGADDKTVAWARTYATKDLAGFNAFIECAPRLVPVDPSKHSAEVRRAKVVLTDEEVSACRQLGLTEETYRKYNPVD